MRKDQTGRFQCEIFRQGSTSRCSWAWTCSRLGGAGEEAHQLGWGKPDGEGVVDDVVGLLVDKPTTPTRPGRPRHRAGARMAQRRASTVVVGGVLGAGVGPGDAEAAAHAQPAGGRLHGLATGEVACGQEVAVWGLRGQGWEDFVPMCGVSRRIANHSRVLPNLSKLLWH